MGPELSAKRLELLKQAVPRITQVAVLRNSASSTGSTAFQAMEITAQHLKLGLRIDGVKSPDEFDSAFTALTKNHASAIAIAADPMLQLQGHCRSGDEAAAPRDGIYRLCCGRRPDD